MPLIFQNVFFQDIFVYQILKLTQRVQTILHIKGILATLCCQIGHQKIAHKTKND